MKTRNWMACALLLALLSIAAPGQSQEEGPVVERIEILNNQFLQRDTLLYYVSSKAGDRYEESRLKDDFRRLWDTGFLEDLQLDVVDGQRGKVVRFRIVERKRIQIVDYRGSKELTTTQIEDELKKREAKIKLDTFYDITKARKVESILREMLHAKGRPFATIKHENKNIGGSGTQVSFIISDGARAKLKEVNFDGNAVFSDAKLRSRMKKIKPTGFWNLSWLGGKTTFIDEKWNGSADDPTGDHGRVQSFYLDNGYAQVRVGQPKVSYFDGRAGLFRKKPVKWMRLEIPVTEGSQFRVGEVKFEGVKLFKEAFVRPMFKLQKGEIYNESRLKKGVEKLRDVYGQFGYFQMTGGPKREPDAEKRVVDVTVAVEEDKQYFIGKINFAGNDSTRDKVIRREIFMNEGDVFNLELLKVSVRRINQLGYFKQMEGAPQIEPSERAEDKMDITFKVEEQNRNQFTFGGGMSGYEGYFLNASFSTSNFLGAGETFTVYAQTGKRTKNYSLGVSEPYFLDKPITAGFELFKRKTTSPTYNYTAGYTNDSLGGSFTLGLSVGRFGRVFASYIYQVVKISGADPADVYDPYYGYSAYGSPAYGIPTVGDGTSPQTPLFDPFFYGDEKRRESRISPTFVWNTVDSPYTPRRGYKFTTSAAVAGGPLGGTMDYLSPSVEGIAYIPHLRKTALGVRGEVAWLIPYGDTVRLPFYQRYNLGGEMQMRGYPVRSVGPRDSTYNPLGGNKFALFNAEYYFDVFGPLRMLLFFDAGQAFLEGDPIDIQEFRTCMGVEGRFVMPVLNVPFRLIYSYNARRDWFQDKNTFKFAVGTTF